MQEKICKSIAVLFVLCLGSNIIAQTPIPAAPAISSTSYMVMDHNSGKIIAEKNSSERLPPASITKLMTAYVAFKKLQDQSLSLDDQVSISKRAYDAEGSRMFVEINSKVRLEDLIIGMIVQSGNDASIAIAEHIGGTEDAFATLMNYHANLLGMKNTQYMNSTGLPAEGHFSTAGDIAILSRAIIKEFPEYYRWYRQKKFTYNDITQHNRNTLLDTDSSVDGIKTGSTDEAGYCLVASASRDGMRLISVVMGTKSKRARADASQALLDHVYNFYKTHRLYAAGDTIHLPQIWKSSAESVPVGLASDLYVTIPKGQYAELKATMDLQQPLIAPVAKGAVLGTVMVRLHDNAIAEVPLIALQNIDEGGFFRRVSHSIMLWFE